MIILENVTKTYSSGTPALNGINLHVQKGEFVFIVGKSGSGKSTLIKLLLKELDPTTGKIYIMLSMVGLLDKYKAYPNELSGGEQQRVAIARALVNRPAILLCDEPTGNLDPANSAEIMKILNQANKLGTTVLVVTHNMEIVQQMKKRTITMSEGKIISDLEKGGYFYED